MAYAHLAAVWVFTNYTTSLYSIIRYKYIILLLYYLKIYCSFMNHESVVYDIVILVNTYVLFFRCFADY